MKRALALFVGLAFLAFVIMGLVTLNLPSRALVSLDPHACVAGVHIGPGQMDCDPAALKVKVGPFTVLNVRL